MDYNQKSPESILEYAQKLPGHSLDELVNFADQVENLKNKGNLGTLVEEYFFKIHPGNFQGPDFEEAGVELKVTGVVKKKDGQYKAKERLVLSMIDYMGITLEDWDNNSLMKKCKQMLILFYIYDANLPVIKRKFALRPLLWDFPKSDLEIIRQDWQTIVDKVRRGKAHELSEGDTFYLAACRKGSGGPKEPLRKQPYSDILAKSRAFSLKPSYINKIISVARHQEDDENEDLLFKNAQHANSGFVDTINMKLHRYIGKNVEEISKMVDFKNNKHNKSYLRLLFVRMLSGRGRTIPELEKADIELKVIRINQKLQPLEDISFPHFSYLNIAHQNWEESDFYAKIERKFLFVIFQDHQGELIFRGALFWNMPYADREEARKVWNKTKKQILSGHAEDLPKKSENPIVHVRPHARNALDTLPTPQGDFLIKKCFWLNAKYIQKQLQLEFGKNML